jgi:hypothetical protein
MAGMAGAASDAKWPCTSMTRSAAARGLGSRRRVSYRVYAEEEKAGGGIVDDVLGGGMVLRAMTRREEQRR